MNRSDASQPTPQSHPSPRNVSIRSVAEHSGVSIATVSRVLNNPSLVSPSTAAKVQASVAELGYRPNLFAKSLLSRRSRVIGVSLPDIHGEYYAELMHRADARACEHGYHLLISSNAHHPEEGPENGFAIDLVDGLLVMLTERSRVDLDAIASLRKPAVVMGVDRPGCAVETITWDNEVGTRSAVEHLLKGTPPGRVHFVGAHRGNLDSDERFDAFVRTMRAHGHEPDERQMDFGEFSFEWGWSWANEMIGEGGLRGTAVLAANDEIAVGIANAARDRGLEMPGDFRLVGFDDSRICRFLRPELSSVRLPIAEMAQAAVDALIRRVEQPESAPRHARLASSLVVRDSSRVTGAND